MGAGSPDECPCTVKQAAGTWSSEPSQKQGTTYLVNSTCAREVVTTDSISGCLDKCHLCQEEKYGVRNH